MRRIGRFSTCLVVGGKGAERQEDVNWEEMERQVTALLSRISVIEIADQ